MKETSIGEKGREVNHTLPAAAGAPFHDAMGKAKQQAN